MNTVPANLKTTAPYRVGDCPKQYAHWLAAVREGKRLGLPVRDAHGVTIWAPM